MEFLENPEVSAFLRAYRVRVPSKKTQRHDPGYAAAQVAVVREVRKFASPQGDIANALDTLEHAWSQASEGRAVPVVPSEDKPTFSLGRHLGRDGLNPNISGLEATKESAQEAIDALIEAIRTLPPEAPPKARGKIKGWIKGWKAIRARLSMDFGGADTKKSGPPPEELARRAAKREESRRIRAQMKKK